MTPERWKQIDELFDQVLDLAPAERAAFLRVNCADDAELRREVAALLAAHEQAGEFIEEPPHESVQEVLDKTDTLIGKHIGPYQIQREIGRGGMGVVYLAVRADEEYRQQVAIKLVWSGPQNAELLRRFRRERQILANLDHPNIARLLDGGRTEQGWPYLVMEYIEGVRITQYCDERKLSISERLHLFRDVCAAVQYAHQNLVIHRDLKPSNILVTRQGTVKLLDFGIAKLLTTDVQQPTELSDGSPFTTKMHLMTPEYASPEQIRGESVTTASDVYSLGLILYELLSGHYPYRLKSRALPDVIAAICGEDPESPSTAVNRIVTRSSGGTKTQPNITPESVSQTREGRPEKLRGRLRGDLDSIVLTALSKDLQQRYLTVEQLSEDIRRHLEGKAVFARQHTRLYRAGKFIQQYKRGVAMTALLLLTLIGGIITTVWQMRVAREQARANRRLAYDAQMNLAQQAWQNANIPRVLELLAEHVPQSGQEDLRGFEWYYLWRLCHREQLNLPHDEAVYGVAFSPAGTLLATAGGDKLIRLRDLAAQREIAVFSGHTDLVECVAFSPDGELLASGSDDQSIRLWDVTANRQLALLKGHTGVVRSVVFSPDGKTLASASEDDTARLWDVNAQRERARLPHGGDVISAVFSPDGRTLATASWDKTIKLWDAATGAKLATLNGAGDRLVAVAFSPDGNSLAAGSELHLVRRWHKSSDGVWLELQPLTGHTSYVYALAFSPDGRLLASASGDHTVRFWDTLTGQEAGALAGHADEIFALAFSPDGSQLATGSADKTAKLWRVGGNLESAALNGHDNAVRALAFSPDNKILATGSDDHTARLWEVATSREINALIGHSGPVTGVAFSPDGTLLATISRDNTVRLWQTASWQETARLSGHQDQIRALAFAPDGQTLATAGNDQTIRLWQVATGKELAVLNAEHRVLSLAFSPRGDVLAAGSGSDVMGQGSLATLWQISTKQKRLVLANHTDQVTSVAFSPDGALLATASEDKTVRLWEAATGKELAVFRGHTGEVQAVRFSPDGRRLVTASTDKTVRVWDVGLRQELLTLRGHRDMVHAVAFAPNGEVLATGGRDRTAQLWRAATAQDVAAEQRPR
ncbi:MAG: protein kinase [Acidobacteria bacterium]|nr:protein kinase [Acidobacteriota bacterium]